MAKNNVKKARAEIILGGDPQAAKSTDGIKKLYILGGIVAILLLGFMIFTLLQKPGGRKTTLAYESVIKQVEMYNRAGQYDKSKALLNQFIEQKPAPPTQQISSAETAMSNIFSNTGDQVAAADWQLKALDDLPKPTVGAYIYLGQVYENAKQKDKALEVYKKALDLNKKTEDIAQGANTNYLNTKISSLQGSN